MTGFICTDVINASRTMLLTANDIVESSDGLWKWRGDLCELFSISESSLPSIQPPNAHFGTILWDGNDNEPFCGALVGCSIGDQQASLLAHCFASGCFLESSKFVEQTCIKCTFGTGAFMLAVCNHTCRPSQSLPAALFNTVACVPYFGKASFAIRIALEGGFSRAASLVDYFVDDLHLFKSVHEIDECFCQCAHSNGVVIRISEKSNDTLTAAAQSLISIENLSSSTTKANIARAIYECIAIRTKGLYDKFMAVLPVSEHENHHMPKLNVDGGLTACDRFMQLLADVLQCRIGNSHSYNIYLISNLLFVCFLFFNGEI